MDKQPVFIVDVGEPGRKIRPPPARMQTAAKAKTQVTLQQLEEKQILAEKRRKEQEEQMIQRVREVREECIKLDSNVQKLLLQDAKRQGLPGTDSVKIMSKTEAKKTIKAVANDFANISSKITITENTD